MNTKFLENKRKIYGNLQDNLFDNIKSIVKAGNNGCSVIVPHVCSNTDNFSSGFAGAIAKHYPVVKENYHLLGSSFLNANPGYVQYVEVYKDAKFGHQIIFANMVCQQGTISKQNPRPLNYLSLVKSMSSVSQYINSKFDRENRVQIHCPKFGIGSSGGNWNFIEDLIYDIWVNTPTFIYYNN
jgi:hypothetical protein